MMLAQNEVALVKMMLDDEYSFKVELIACPNRLDGDYERKRRVRYNSKPMFSFLFFWPGERKMELLNVREDCRCSKLWVWISY